MKYEKHKEFFSTAYRTGSDTWTHLPLENRGELLMDHLPKNSLILDVGSGRGLFSKKLVEFGYRVVGLDFEPNIVRKTNENVLHWGLEGKLKFVEGSALDIPFTDNGFDGVCDFGLIENLYPEDWEVYANEIGRVLKPGGFYLNIALSSETQQFFEFSPKALNGGSFKKYDVTYHFFKKDEMKNIFNHQLNPIEQNIKVIERPNHLALLETLFQKPE
ncbi:MAG: class I SAM-dependent methyltransferase [Candidatus Nomurabacteria bacterium]|nr:class I SAM-dependent methyltransferase [Candidatus Nomurabacteria bacterium]